MKQLVTGDGYMHKENVLSYLDPRTAESGSHRCSAFLKAPGTGESWAQASAISPQAAWVCLPYTTDSHGPEG